MFCKELPVDDSSRFVFQCGSRSWVRFLVKIGILAELRELGIRGMSCLGARLT